MICAEIVHIVAVLQLQVILSLDLGFQSKDFD